MGGISEKYSYRFEVTLDKSKQASIFYSLFNVRAGDLGETSEGVGVVPDKLFRQEWSNLWVSLFVSFPFTLPLFNDRDLDVFSQVVGDLLRVFSQFSQSFFPLTGLVVLPWVLQQS